MARIKTFDPALVIDRAMQLFWRQGYEATSVQELVDALGIGRGSLYDTFGDKHTLFLASLDHYSEMVFTALMPPLQSEGPVRDALHQVFVRVRRGQETGEIPGRHTAPALARFLLTTMQGLRVLAKAQPDRALLEEVVSVALTTLA